MAEVLYLSHPQVAIDPAVPVPDWGLSPLGRARTEAFASLPMLARIGRVVASLERKAIETAEIIAAAQGLAVEIRDGLHENDRSATGFLPPGEFEAMADRFFAAPEASICGWERAVDAQRRIVAGVEAILGERPEAAGITLFVGHGGVGTLLLCHCAGWTISRQHDQPAGGGNLFRFEHPPFRLLDPWQRMEAAGSFKPF
ncbi:MAG TPA: histidine phosphatase family protein [Kaistia sp.]|nr:histidine phosphatase family protein [Kaistia sp.]